MLSVYVRAATAALILLLVPEVSAQAGQTAACTRAIKYEANARDQMVAAGCNFARNAKKPRCRRLYAKIEKAKAARSKVCRRFNAAPDTHVVMPNLNRRQPSQGTYQTMGQINRFLGAVIREGSRSSQGTTTGTRRSGECPPGMHKSAQNPVCHYPENQTTRRAPSGGASPDQVMEFFMGDFIGR